MKALGCEHVMRFPMAKLLDFEPQLADLPHDANPFALVTAAHLSALRTRADVDRRLAAKRQLVRLLYRQGWGKQRVLDLFAILDWMLRLPPPPPRQNSCRLHRTKELGVRMRRRDGSIWTGLQEAGGGQAAATEYRLHRGGISRGRCVC